MTDAQRLDVRSDTDNPACTSASSPPSSIKTVPLDEIHLDKTREGSALDQDTVAVLAQSIPMHGMLHPITVRVCSGGYQLVAGRHRLEAARQAGLAEVEVKVVDANDREATAMSLVENLRRRKLSASEENEAIVELLKLEAVMNGKADAKADEQADVPRRNTGVAKVAKKTGKSKTAISQAGTREKKAHPHVQAAFKAHRIKAGHVDELVRLEPDLQEKLLPVAVGLKRNQLRNRVDEELGISKRCKNDGETPDVGSFIGVARMLVTDAESLDITRLGQAQRELLRTTSEELVTALNRLLDALRATPVRDAPAAPASDVSMLPPPL